MVNALSPLDGRYSSKTESLRAFFSEEALIRYRIFVEIEYFNFLHELGILSLSQEIQKRINDLVDNFSQESALRIKEIEKTTNHDVKAVEHHRILTIRPCHSCSKEQSIQ